MKLLLDQGELLDLGKNRQGMRILCQTGTFWLTQAGDSRDYILREGEQFEVHEKGHLVLYASGQCHLQLIAKKSANRLQNPAAVLMQ